MFGEFFQEHPSNTALICKKDSIIMIIVKGKLQEFWLLCGYICVLFVSAIVRDFVIAPYVAQHMSGPGAVLIEPIWKLLFWIMPTFFYIKFVEDQNPLTYLKLSTNVLQGLLWGLFGCIFVVALEFGKISSRPRCYFPEYRHLGQCDSPGWFDGRDPLSRILVPKIAIKFWIHRINASFLAALCTYSRSLMGKHWTIHSSSSSLDFGLRGWSTCLYCT